MPAPKRFRPPNLTLAGPSKPLATIHQDSPASPTNFSSSLSSPSTPSSPSSELQLSSPSSFGSSPNSPPESDPQDDIGKDLRALEQLRRSVQQNLRLRPIRSNGALPKVNLNIKTTRPFLSPDLPGAWREFESTSALTPASSTSAYYTPLSPSRSSPLSARYLGGSNNGTRRSPQDLHTPRTPSPRPTQQALEPTVLADRLTAAHRPLVIDTRSPSSHAAAHIRHSINIAIPSLILKRCRKPAHAFQSLDALRQFITSEAAKEEWDTLLTPGGMWDGDVIVYDEGMDAKDKDNISSPAWALLSIITPLLSYGTIDYLQGGFAAAKADISLRTFIISDGSVENEPATKPTKNPGGLFQLDTQAASRSKAFPEIEQPGHSPLPMMPTATRSRVDVTDSSPSPPPSQIAFRRPPPPRRPSAPNLRKIDTTSAERLNTNLPKLQVHTTRTHRAATLTVPPISLSVPPQSPSHLSLVYSNRSPPGSARWPVSPPSSASEFVSEHYTSYFTPPHTPGTPMPAPTTPSPATARPDIDQPPTTEDAFPVFTISTILPNFLYLGPELTTDEHVQELKKLGVKRILNIAAECDDDHGLGLREVFEKYVRIPMRDTVEEENIAKGVREVCDILDDARLHSSPTYVHCKAGKSRSVTAVMAYLIHANHWTLSRAYAFVLERRKGISPNIGFVSELMTFEEQELGGKSVGVQPAADGHDGDSGEPGGGGGGGHGNYVVAAQNRRLGHVRESLPPILMHSASSMNEGNGPGGMGAGMDAAMGDSGQEMEIKDREGRYRHARRAPVDENTLQPLRRVSKAGLESSSAHV